MLLTGQYYIGKVILTGQYHFYSESQWRLQRLRLLKHETYNKYWVTEPYKNCIIFLQLNSTERCLYHSWVEARPCKSAVTERKSIWPGPNCLMMKRKRTVCCSLTSRALRHCFISLFSPLRGAIVINSTEPCRHYVLVIRPIERCIIIHSRQFEMIRRR